MEPHRIVSYPIVSYRIVSRRRGLVQSAVLPYLHGLGAKICTNGGRAARRRLCGPLCRIGGSGKGNCAGHGAGGHLDDGAGLPNRRRQARVVQKPGLSVRELQPPRPQPVVGGADVRQPAAAHRSLLSASLGTIGTMGTIGTGGTIGTSGTITGATSVMRRAREAPA